MSHKQSRSISSSNHKRPIFKLSKSELETNQCGLPLNRQVRKRGSKCSLVTVLNGRFATIPSFCFFSFHLFHFFSFHFHFIHFFSFHFVSFRFILTGDKNGSIRAWSTSLNSFPMVTQFLGAFDYATYTGAPDIYDSYLNDG